MNKLINNKGFQNLALLNLLLAPILIFSLVGFNIFYKSPNLTNTIILIILTLFGVFSGCYLFQKGKQLKNI